MFDIVIQIQELNLNGSLLSIQFWMVHNPGRKHVWKDENSTTDMDWIEKW